MSTGSTFVAGAPKESPAYSRSSVRDYWTLLKPGVMSLVVFTGAAGIVVAPGTLHPFLGCVALLCIAIGSGAGGALNMWYDRDIDALMARTAKRPLPAGRIAPNDALAFGMILAVGAVALMGIAVNWAAAGILAFAIFFYAVVYTQWLKRATPQNIVIGGAAGAFPPLIGWVAVTGDVSLYSVVLFLIIFLWTPPHFWALALYRCGDYARAGVPMLPVAAGPDETRRQIVLYTTLLIPVTMMPVFLQDAGMMYAAVALSLGALFLKYARALKVQATDAAARKLFLYSILYLFLLFAGLMIDKWVDKALQLALTSGTF
jgi:protoheme IX farnesyltransferase